MSTWSARSSSTIIWTALPIVTGSTPYSCSDRGRSSGWNVIMCIVVASRSTSARLVIISQTYSPAPYCRHSCRKAVLALTVLLIATYMLVRLMISTRPPRQGDDLVIRVLPPRIEVRYRGPDQDEVEPPESAS